MLYSFDSDPIVLKMQDGKCLYQLDIKIVLLRYEFCRVQDLTIAAFNGKQYQST